MRISHHAKQRLLERVFGIEDVDDKRSLMLAAKILNDNSSHLEGMGNQIVPLVGFTGVSLQIRNETVTTVLINKGR